MPHPIHRVVSFAIEGPYTLRVRFEDHTDAALQRIQHDFMQALRKVKPDAQVGAAAH